MTVKELIRSRRVVQVKLSMPHSERECIKKKLHKGVPMYVKTQEYLRH